MRSWRWQCGKFKAQAEAERIANSSNGETAGRDWRYQIVGHMLRNRGGKRSAEIEEKMCK